MSISIETIDRYAIKLPGKNKKPNNPNKAVAPHILSGRLLVSVNVRFGQLPLRHKDYGIHPLFLTQGVNEIAMFFSLWLQTSERERKFCDGKQKPERSAAH